MPAPICPSPSPALRQPCPSQAFNLLGNAGIGTADAASVNATATPVVPTNGATDADLAASQQMPQAEEQPLATGSR